MIASFSRVAVDLDLSAQGPTADEYRELAIGGEHGFFQGRLAVRGGVRFEIGSELGARPALSMGVGANLWRLLIEASYATSSAQRDEGVWLNVTFH